MALPNFPDSPVLNQEFTVGNVIYKCTAISPNPVWAIKAIANVPGADTSFATVAAMKLANTSAGLVATCTRYHADSKVMQTLNYLSRGVGWPVTADNYVNHADAGGNFLELIYDVLDVRQAGAYGGGTTTDTVYIQKAVDYLQTLGGGRLEFVDGTFKTSKILVPAVPITFVGHNATMVPVNVYNDYCFSKESRGGRLEVHDITFNGFFRAINIDMPTSEEMFYDFLITKCKFVAIVQQGWGIYLDGAREGNIDKCYFESFGGGMLSGGGIYRTLTVNTNVRDSIFKELRFGIYDDGQGSPYSAGNHILGCVMLGVNFGVTAIRGDSYLIDGCMIDYCDVPIRFFSQDGAKVVNNYLSSRTAAPVIDIKKDPDAPILEPTTSFGIKILNNTIITHHTLTEANAIEIFDAQDCTIAGNYIQFFNYLGIRFKACTYLTIQDNEFAPRPGSPFTTYCVANFENDSNTSNKFINNSCQGNALTPTSMNILARHNTGFVTQAAGIATLLAGTTTVTVPHGMALAPGVVLLSPQAAGDFWWDLDGVTGINIRASSSTGLNRQIAWAAYSTYAIAN